MSPQAAIDQLQRKRDAVPAAMVHARRVLGEAIVARLRQDWPRGTGKGPRSADQWRYDEQRGVVNDSPHVEYVGDDLADEMVAALQVELHPLYAEALTRYLDEVT